MSASLVPWHIKRIGTQIVTLVIFAILIGNLLISAIFFVFQPRHPGDRADEALTSVARLIDNAPTPAAKGEMLESATRAFPNLRLAMQTAPPAASAPLTSDPFLKLLHDRLGPEYSTWRTETDTRGGVGVAIRLHDGLLLTAEMPRSPLSKFFLGPTIVSVIFVVLLVILFSIWAARGIVSPLSRFVEAAEHFDPDTSPTPLPEEGPEEIRQASAAFNRMRDRITHLLRDRTGMLTAIGHDLRTPITRLRLRAEFIEDEAMRVQMIGDLSRMNAMVGSALSFLRTGQTSEPMTALDLSSMLRSICDQFADGGADVTYDGSDQCVIEAREDELHRAVTNLVENGVKFGEHVVVRLRRTNSHAEIEVEDDGPGIPDDEKADVLKPFARGDTARSESGFGLGLSIANAIVKAHGGALKLLDRRPHGLTSRMELPLSIGV